MLTPHLVRKLIQKTYETSPADRRLSMAARKLFHEINLLGLSESK
jgi:hypothetical protein